MQPIKFSRSNVIFAKNQPEYLQLPAHSNNGVVTSCWQLSLKERLHVLCTGRLWLQQMTFDTPLQPQRPSIKKPKLGGD